MVAITKDILRPPNRAWRNRWVVLDACMAVCQRLLKEKDEQGFSLAFVSSGLSSTNSKAAS